MGRARSMRVFVLLTEGGVFADGLLAEDRSMDKRCTFLPQSQGDGSMVNLSGLLEEAVLQLRKDVPLELVVNMFQKLVRFFLRLQGPRQMTDIHDAFLQNLRHIVFSHEGKLMGMVTKTDIVRLLTADSSHAGALSTR